MKWDYTVIETLNEARLDVEKRLVNLGQEGWEVCGVYGTTKVILKRLINEEEE